MFRVLPMERKPENIKRIGIPPLDRATIGRINDEGKPVLYLADSPDTAFAEARATSGDFCLSEWRVTAEKLALTNGGISQDLFSSAFLSEGGNAGIVFPTANKGDEQTLKLFRKIFTLPVNEDRTMYRWSIACGMANGFAHICDRGVVQEVNGNTIWPGRYPFAAIAYSSVRSDRFSVNYALNDKGRANIKLNHVQWVHRSEDGSFTSVDFSDIWDQDGRINWRNGPAKFILKPGEQTTVVKTSETTWSYETADGSIPWFG